MPKCDFNKVALQLQLLLLCNFTEIELRHECSPANLLHIFKTPFYENPYGGLILQYF